MSITVVHRAPAVLKSRRPSGEPSVRAPMVAPVATSRAFQVLQSSHAPAQLCLFLRRGVRESK